MRKPLVVANWKMHKTVGEALSFVDFFLPQISESDFCEIVLCPPFTALWAVAQRLAGTTLQLGAQDLFWKDQGAFTGEISPVMLRDVGCSFVIIGHSERRGRFGKPDPEVEEPDLSILFSETDRSVNKKIHAALTKGLKPIVCVGETLAERQDGKTEEIVDRQVKRALREITQEQAVHLTVAYEPVWAIGTGQVCDAQEAQRICRLIRDLLTQEFGKAVAEQVRILYGGSITPENIEELSRQPDIDGGLVGGASLNPDSFARIVQTVYAVKAGQQT
ncbi:MAG: triose-phosphate isomerase [Armatimonadota bacterium]|nr:triose-phosphate isomerase [Armatimonadota bacterium]